MKSCDEFWNAVNDSFFTTNGIVTANTTKYTIENDITKKEKKEKKKTNKHTDKWHVLI